MWIPINEQGGIDLAINLLNLYSQNPELFDCSTELAYVTLVRNLAKQRIFGIIYSGRTSEEYVKDAQVFKLSAVDTAKKLAEIL